MQSDARNAEMLSKVRLSMISSFAAVVRVPWTVATITFSDAEIVRIRRNCPKRKSRRTATH